jgi:uncharacterized RDD family membrane protein YckC
MGPIERRVTEPPPSESAVTPQEQPPERNVQVLGRRFMAILIDSVLFILLERLLTRPLVPVHLRVLHPNLLRGTLTLGLEFVTPNILGWLVLGIIIYFAFFELLFAATPGKLLAGLRVADLDGNQPTRREILIRNIVRPVDLIGFYLVGGIIVLLNKRRQRLGDMAARTLVIGAWTADWIDRSRGGTQRRIGVMGVSILVVVLAGGILTYLLPPSILPALNEKFYPVDAGPVSTKIPGAQRVLDLSVRAANRTGGTALYPLRITVSTNSGSGPRICAGTISYTWSGPLDGWTFSRIATRCS